MRGSRTLVGLLAVLLPGIVLLPVWQLGGLGAGEDDILYYFPSRAWFHELLQAGQPPWLNPWNGLDRPLLADPQAAITYPATWLFAVLSPKTAYPASLWMHYALALFGTYRLLRAEPLHRRAALFGAVAFAFCGFLLAHRAHFTMQQAAAWAPLVFWRVRRFAECGGGGRLTTAALIAAGQCFAGHVQIAALTALGTLVPLAASVDRTAAAAQLRIRAARWLGCWLAAGGLFAVQLVPTILYIQECTRTSRTYLDFCENSWLPFSSFGWVLPMLFGQRTPNFFDQEYWAPSHQVEQFSYLGLAPVLLAFATIRSGWRDDPRRRGWVGLGLLALLTALGMFGPIAPILYWLPGASVFRVPARAMLLFSLAASALAAYAVHDLGAPLTPRRARVRFHLLNWSNRAARITAVLIFGPPLAIAAVMLFLPAESRNAALHALRPWNPALWVPLILLAATLALLRWSAQRWQRPAWLHMATALTVVDLAIIGWTIDIPRNAHSIDDVLHSPTRDAWLPPLADSPERLWVVTRRIDGTPAEYIDPLGKCSSNTNVLDHVPSLTDYGPLTPRRFAAAFDFKPWGEPVDPDTLLCDPRWMQRFNIGWLMLCADDLHPPNTVSLAAVPAPNYRLYRHPNTRGMAFFDDASYPGVVRYLSDAPHSFSTIVDTWPARGAAGQVDRPPPRIVVARQALPGWRATCSGKDVPVETSDGTLLAARLPEHGPSRIEWQYSPPGLSSGAAISIATALLLATIAIRYAAGQSTRNVQPDPSRGSASIRPP